MVAPILTMLFSQSQKLQSLQKLAQQPSLFLTLIISMEAFTLTIFSSISGNVEKGHLFVTTFQLKLVKSIFTMLTHKVILKS